MTELRKGQRVKVSFEGEVVEVDGIERWVTVVHGGSHRAVIWTMYATIEPIEDLRHLDVYRSEPEDGAMPHVVAYLHPNSPEPWYCLTCAQRSRDSLVPRPLTLLVRDGKAVQ